MCQIQVDTHSKTRVQIPARDYDIDRSDVEILCRYSNSRAPGGMCRNKRHSSLLLYFCLFIWE